VAEASVLVSSRSVRSLLILGLTLAAGLAVARPAEGQGSNAPAVADARQPARESRFAVGVSASVSKGYAVGVQVGPFGQYWPTHWFGLQASAFYLNDAYMYFSFYRVNGVQLSADVAFRFWRLTATLGPVMDHYFAPVVDKRIWGWQAGLRCELTRRGPLAASAEGCYVNRVNPRLYDWARHGEASVTPLGLLVADAPMVRVSLVLTRMGGAR